ncbi:beta-ketoacyl-ACP synthase III [Oceanirhabdus seepicola]|uniref:Beta-ketoacyl-[acyl-carrier-protein] synthase III n=1 Tax=Oceanirhabdus seepicola TaxID=2828781 RepID=A0A9J6P6E4_9CLOT|nr:beta-ketoacyl-ACP synthase III [Oceanirhabdus seepicola]MCM1992311.1 ketoacyl-ACP synthase III [Oceanirhabdus seepicola]
MKNVKIIATGQYTPDNIVTNFDLEKIVETSDEWIESRTGISKRRISDGEDTSQLAFKAGKNALDKNSILPEDIDLIIVATCSPDYHVPSTACVVQGLLGAHNAVAFDITAACSGLIYGMKIAKQFMMEERYKKALVIGSEVLSRIIDWKDRNTCVLFGDGASAVVLEQTDENIGIKDIDIYSDGAAGMALTCKTRPLRNLCVESDEELDHIQMSGSDIFRFGVKVIAKNVKDVLERNNLTINDIKYIVPHQANTRIIETAARKLKVSSDKFYTNLSEYGNTSAASIGIALNEMMEKNLIQRGDKFIMVGFGGGLSWGYALVEY